MGYTIILHIVDIAWNLGNVDGYTSLVVKRGEHSGSFVAGVRGTQACGKPAETVPATGPLGDGEYTGTRVIWGLSDVAEILCIVEPLVGTLPTVGLAVDILDAEGIVGIDLSACRTGLVFAELELAKSVIAAVLGCAVPTAIVVAKPVAVLPGKDVALSY